MTATQESTTPEIEEDELLLDLSEAADRPRVKGPDGKVYELKVADDYGARAWHSLQMDTVRFNELQEKRRLRPAEAERMESLLSSVFDRVIDAPDEAKAQFTDARKLQVIRFFHIRWLNEQGVALQRATQALKAGDDSTTES